MVGVVQSMSFLIASSELAEARLTPRTNTIMIQRQVHLVSILLSCTSFSEPYSFYALVLLY